MRRHPSKSTNVVAHIRKARQGARALENCHPFQRERWGRYCVFAHNGNSRVWTPIPPGELVVFKDGAPVAGGAFAA